MSRRVQEQIRKAWPHARRFLLLAILFPLPPALTACTAHDLGRLPVDTSIATGSVEPALEPPVAAAETDAQAIALAFEQSGWNASDAVDWRNTTDGARGAIGRVTTLPSSDGDVACRRFTTTRERFDGIGLLRGKACREDSGMWRVTALEEV